MEADQPGLGFICFNVTHGAVELTSLTAKPAVPLCLCRGLCSSCLPALTVVWTCYDKKKKEPFSTVHSVYLYLCVDMTLTLHCGLSLAVTCLYPLSIFGNKADFLQCPPAVSRLLFFPSVPNFFSLAADQRDHKLPLLHPFILPTATNKYILYTHSIG